MQKREVAYILGDGIGPEIVGATMQVIDAVTGGGITWTELHAGLQCLHDHGSALPEHTLTELQRIGVGLKGPTTTPSGGGHASINVALRRRLGLDSCVRPMVMPVTALRKMTRINVVVVREATEGFYAHSEERLDDVVTLTCRFSKVAFAKSVRRAFEIARRRGMHKVLLVLKMNIFKMWGALYKEAFDEVAAEFRDIKAMYSHFDAAQEALVLGRVNDCVIVTENLMGDGISDLTGGIGGGLGVAPGACMGSDVALFECTGGTFPAGAGKNIANPSAMMRSGALLLNHLGLDDEARRLDAAVILAMQVTPTQDFGGTASTTAFTQAVLVQL